ncbi:glycosyltransferase 87 family protein [Streptacidiphilus cavernicola]|uniref:Glycosyltransferase 87 family protein n=1 Tax=Streptacidiphilus cavernicola TaxID=3342716 RepID=A0ABV6VNB7_9ACTN
MTTTQVPTRTERPVPAAARLLPARSQPRLRRWTSGRRPWVLGWLGCAVWAGCFPLASGLMPQRVWGGIAAIGYLLALAAAGLLPRHRVARVSTALALLGAVAVPLAVLVARSWSQSEVLVVQNSAVRLLHTGTPYLADPHQVIGYDPYLPAMALFGLPRALLGDHVTALRLVGDARIWFLAAFAACLIATWRLLQPRGGARGARGNARGARRVGVERESAMGRSRGAGVERGSGMGRSRGAGVERGSGVGRGASVRRGAGAGRSRGSCADGSAVWRGSVAEPGRGWGTAFAAVTASPLIALVAVTGGVDLPLIGCCCLALALAGRGHAARAGLVLALACAIKWTAWPALPVAALLLHQLYGRRAALRCAVVALGLGAALIAPFALLSPGAVVEQVIRFPLGLSPMRTPADSPLPGHLLAELGGDGRIASFVLLGLGGAAVTAWILLRPPRTAVQAADRLAVGVGIAFLLAPAGRFGYLELPALLLLWPRLATVRPTPTPPPAPAVAPTATPTRAPAPTRAAAPAPTPPRVPALLPALGRFPLPRRAVARAGRAVLSGNSFLGR